MEEYNCYDCGCEIQLKDKDITNGKLLKYKKDDKEHLVFKCTECFKKDPSLKVQQCEVWSRIVGYLRPVNQWNVGKQKEYKDRKEYKIKKELTN